MIKRGIFFIVLVFFISCESYEMKKTKNEHTQDEVRVDTMIDYKATQILAKMEKDICQKGFFYFDPGNVEDEYIGGKIHVFWDNSNWVLCYEIVTFSYAGQAICARLFWFGEGMNIPKEESHLHSNFNSVVISDYKNLIKVFGKNMNEAQSGSDSLMINGKKFLLPDQSVVKSHIQKKVPGYIFNYIGPTEVMRYFIDYYPDDIFLNEEIIKRTLNIQLPEKLIVKSWRHQSFNCDEGTPPRESGTLKKIAESIERKDHTVYRGDKNPNTDWKYWWERY